MSAAKLVTNLRSSTLPQKNFDNTSVIVIIRYHNFVDVTWFYAAFKPTQST